MAADDRRDAWAQAARDPAIDAELRALYERLGAEIARRGPTCWSSGRCCNFEAYGHRLYVTGLEIAWLLERLHESEAERPAAGGLPAEPRLRVLDAGPDRAVARSVDRITGALRDGDALPDACPFQVDRLCGVHALRPLGCRVFFCQEGTHEWQRELYEQFLLELRRLHERFALPYRYMEWRAGLREAVAVLLSRAESDRSGRKGTGLGATAGTGVS